jgi:hypothetical protein
LFDCCRPKSIGCGQQDPVALCFEKICQLRGGGCFASSVDADDQNDFRMRRQRTNGWRIDRENTTDFVSRNLGDVICRYPRPGFMLA